MSIVLIYARLLLRSLFHGDGNGRGLGERTSRGFVNKHRKRGRVHGKREVMAANVTETILGLNGEGVSSCSHRRAAKHFAAGSCANHRQARRQCATGHGHYIGSHPARCVEGYGIVGAIGRGRGCRGGEGNQDRRTAQADGLRPVGRDKNRARAYQFF
jgi:hypothetical protein